ncbi:hypothetical protein HA402_007724 [Bradysia odoriphaga]|nr:hypothetical protein HA402_007724 [Bradysia odoriphaga]
MSKLSFRARALDPTKPMPIYLTEELPDLPEHSAINRAVPQMPSGMEKEEESEHHLQRAICTGLIIPTPEVLETDRIFYEKCYPADFKPTRQMIHMQPLGMEQDIPDYDMDSADEAWVTSQGRRLNLTPLKFEEMMDRLEKSSGQTVVTVNEAKALLKQDDELSVTVYDYWLNKRLKMQHPLILSIRTENRPGAAPNNPYLAFRRRTEKMQTRKNRKNDETSYEKMLKLRRDLSRAVTLLDMVKRREKTKQESLHLSIEIFEKRFQARDFSGHLLNEYTNNAVKSAATRPAFAPIYANQYSHSTSSAAQSSPLPWAGNHHPFLTQQYHSVTAGANIKREADMASSCSGRKEKRQYKKRKHKTTQRDKPYPSPGPVVEPASSDEDEPLASNHLGHENAEDEGSFVFKRLKPCTYQKPLTKEFGNWPWTSKTDNGLGDPKYRYTLTSLGHGRQRCIGFARRRTGRGGRVIMDRCSTSMDEWWSGLDYTIFDNDPDSIQQQQRPYAEATSVKVKTDTEPLSDSIVVDLINNRKNSMDNVSRTRTPLECGDSDIVIRNEQNSINVKKEKLDDYELAGSHSSNMLGTSSMFDRNFSEIPSNSSSSIERNGSVTDVKIEIPSESIQIDRAKSPVKTDDDLYSDFLNEIRRDWLHFRPKTPPDLHNENSNELGEQSSPFTEATSLTVEIQRLGEQPPSFMLTDAQDNLFRTSPFTFEDLTVDESPAVAHDSSSSLLENNLSGESLPELSFSLENEDNEKMLENILQECQFDDLKSFNTNANFWNGILEDDVMDDPKKTSFERIASDLLPLGDDRMKRGKRKQPHRPQRIGSSTITISSIPETPFFRKEKPSDQQQPDLSNNTPKISSPLPIADNVNVIAVSNRTPEIILSTQIKEEPADDEVVPILFKQQPIAQVSQAPQLTIVKTENVSIGNTVPMQQKAFILHQQPAQLQSSPIIQQVSNSGEGTIILSATGTPLRKHTNGPTEKSSFELIKKGSIINRKLHIQQRPVEIKAEEASDVKPKIEGATYIKMAAFPSEFNVVTSNNLALNAAAVASNHNYSLTPQSAVHHQPITLIGQTSQSHNKFIINSVSSSSHTTNASNIALGTQTQDLQLKMQAPLSNFKVNMVPSSVAHQASSLSIASGGKPTILTTQTVHHLTSQQASQQQQPNRKINMVYDNERNRILYVNKNNINSRGQPIFASLNQKVLNIALPMQNKNNASSTVQRIATVGNAQTISNIRQQHIMAPSGSASNQVIVGTSSGDTLTKLVQNSDGGGQPSTGINVNTTSR